MSMWAISWIRPNNWRPGCLPSKSTMELWARESDHWTVYTRTMTSNLSTLSMIWKGRNWVRTRRLANSTARRWATKSSSTSTRTNHWPRKDKHNSVRKRKRRQLRDSSTFRDSEKSRWRAKEDAWYSVASGLNRKAISKPKNYSTRKPIYQLRRSDTKNESGGTSALWLENWEIQKSYMKRSFTSQKAWGTLNNNTGSTSSLRCLTLLFRLAKIRTALLFSRSAGRTSSPTT